MVPVTDETPATRAAANGEAFKPDAAALIGAAVGKHLAPLFAEMLPQVIGNAFASVLEAIPVRTGRLCCKCLTAHVAWEAANATAINDALYAAMLEAGITDRADPRCRQLDVTAYLPDHVPPAPPVNDGVTTADGDEVCALHLPGTPQTPQQPGRKQFLVAQTGNVAAAAKLAGQG